MTRAGWVYWACLTVFLVSCVLVFACAKAPLDAPPLAPPPGTMTKLWGRHSYGLWRFTDRQAGVVVYVYQAYQGGGCALVRLDETRLRQP
jgi:hypothetical protein